MGIVVESDLVVFISYSLRLERFDGRLCLWSGLKLHQNWSESKVRAHTTAFLALLLYEM